ncbi:hypothetical protein [Anaerorhabdus furcosa]|uniref:PH domain-containing protein n=1 Tax=Anaerorhabdus furcosa TaxID=118967 RepID=A0A1T4MX26_9FIRM|nr:hypothetical protein [Anaerorhabdus furcosa]SJZ71347.1 hypothetical protein SAMN02745191_1449 [Anaerorhabdus furcosa]
MENSLIELMNIEDVKNLGTPVKTITSKPYFAIITCLVISILLILSKSLAILGFIILPISLLVLWKIPNRKTIEFFDTFLIVYPQGKELQCKKINFNDIIEWIVRQGQQSGDILVLHLTGDEYVQMESFRAVSVVRQFNKIMPDKEANRKKNAEMKNTKFKWPWGDKK